MYDTDPAYTRFLRSWSFAFFLWVDSGDIAVPLSSNINYRTSGAIPHGARRSAPSFSLGRGFLREIPFSWSFFRSARRISGATCRTRSSVRPRNRSRREGCGSSTRVFSTTTPTPTTPHQQLYGRITQKWCRRYLRRCHLEITSDAMGGWEGHSLFAMGTIWIFVFSLSHSSFLFHPVLRRTSPGVLRSFSGSLITLFKTPVILWRVTFPSFLSVVTG